MGQSENSEMEDLTRSVEDLVGTAQDLRKQKTEENIQWVRRWWLALGLVFLSLATMTVVVWMEASQTREFAVLLCQDNQVLRDILIERFSVTLEAAIQGETGLSGNDQQAQIERITNLLTDLSDTRCDESLIS